jgi:hypothetical protein
LIGNQRQIIHRCKATPPNRAHGDEGVMRIGPPRRDAPLGMSAYQSLLGADRRLQFYMVSRK